MGSHPKTYHRIHTGNSGDNSISCDINDGANLQAGNLVRGTHSAKIQHWEILYYPITETVQFRNSYGVFLGVEGISSGSKIIADAGLSTDISHWRLEKQDGGGFKIKLSSSSLYMSKNATDSSLELSATASVWDIQVSPGVPPEFLLENA